MKGILSYKQRKNVANLARASGLDYASLYRKSLHSTRKWDTIINWGSSIGVYRTDIPWLNRPDQVAVAANKLATLRALRKEYIPVPEFTINMEEAELWRRKHGYQMMGRKLLEASQGKGCVLFDKDAPLTPCKLYTVFKRKAREFRVHVCAGEVIHYTQKKRRRGYKNASDYNHHVRNHGNGWIYTSQDCRYIPELDDLAIKAVDALDLDFGAVDILYHKELPYVLEVNTAPGISSPSTFHAYANAFRKLEC